MKTSVVGFVWKGVVSVPDGWTVVPRSVYWSRSSSSVDSGGDRNRSQLPRLFVVTSVTPVTSGLNVQKHSFFFPTLSLNLSY